MFTRFHHLKKAISQGISERLQRLYDYEILSLRCYVDAKITALFVITEMACCKVCTIGEVTNYSRDRPDDILHIFVFPFSSIQFCEPYLVKMK